MMNDEQKTTCLSIHHSSFIIHHSTRPLPRVVLTRPRGSRTRLHTAI